MKWTFLGLFTAGATLIAVAPPARAQERGHCAPHPAACDCPQCRGACPEGPPVERHYYYQQPYRPDDGCRGELGIRTPSFRIPSLRFGLSFDGDCDRGHCHYLPCQPGSCYPGHCCHPNWCCPPEPPRAPLVSSISAITVPQQAVAINPVAFGAVAPTAVAPTVYAPQMVLPTRPVAPAQVAPAQVAPAQVVPAQLRIQSAPEAPACQRAPDTATIRLLIELLRAESQRTNQGASPSPSSIPQAPAGQPNEQSNGQSNEQKLEELRKQVQELKALLNQL